MPDPHAPYTLRLLWAAAAADLASGLNHTQRAAIVLSMADPQWVPDPDALPETWTMVQRWTTRFQRPASPPTTDAARRLYAARHPSATDADWTPLSSEEPCDESPA